MRIGFAADEISYENGLQIVYENLSKHFRTEIYKPSTLNEYSVLVTNRVELIPRLPGQVIYIATEQDGGLFDPDPEVISDIINNLSKASVFAYSKLAANRIYELYKIPCIVDVPHVAEDFNSSEEFILYYNLPFDVIKEFPNEKLVPFEHVEQLKQAKLYLHKPITNEYYNLRMLFASAYGVPTIAEDVGAIIEFKTAGDSLIPAGSDIRKWIQTVKINMRDRKINSRRAREGINHYNHDSEIVNKIRQNIVDKDKAGDLPKHADFLRNIKYEDKIKQMQERQIVGKRNNRKPAAPQTKVVVSKEERRRGFTMLPIAPTSIFITGGVGDVMAIESYFTKEMRDKLETIYYATHKWQLIKELFAALPNYPNLKNHIPVWDKFDDFWCFIYKEECVQHLQNHNIKPDEEFFKTPDFGIIPFFARINAGKMQYNDSSFRLHRLCSIDKFNLPAEYVAVCPYSSDKRIAIRDFNETDWLYLIRYLEGRDIKGVVLNNSEENIPEHPRLINLAKQTSIVEAVEIVKNACGYIGIDSSMSVIATKVFSPDNIVIKTHNSHLHSYKHIYYAPMKDFNFLGSPAEKLAEPKRFRSLAHSKEITISTVQGLGDIFWVYQKIAPYFDRVNLQILIVQDNPIEKRAEDWVRLFPKVGVVNYRIVDPLQYSILAKSKFALHSILDQWRKGIECIPYAVNAFLEEGVRIDEIDGGSNVDMNVAISTEHVNIPYTEYLLLYVSGSVKQLDPQVLGAWNVDKWVELVEAVYDRYNKRLPVVLIGANFDIVAIDELKPLIHNRLNVECTAYVQAPPAQVLNIIQRANVFIGFQSGLNIMADNFNVKQIMLYYHMLENMSYTWCKRGNIKSALNAFTFKNNIEEIVSSLPEGFLDPPNR